MKKRDIELEKDQSDGMVSMVLKNGIGDTRTPNLSFFGKRIKIKNLAKNPHFGKFFGILVKFWNE